MAREWAVLRLGVSSRRRQQQVFLGRGPGSSTSPAGPAAAAEQPRVR